MIGAKLKVVHGPKVWAKRGLCLPRILQGLDKGACQFRHQRSGALESLPGGIVGEWRSLACVYFLRRRATHEEARLRRLDPPTSRFWKEKEAVTPATVTLTPLF